jgi:hypothetical protein
MKKLLMVVALTGCTQQAMPPSALQPAMYVGESRAQVMAHQTPTTFSFGSLPELWVRLEVPTLPQVASVYTTLTTPMGAPAAGQTNYFSTDPTVTTAQNGLLANPAEAIPATEGGPGWRVDISIPIAGTFVGRASQPRGTWGVTSAIQGVSGNLTASIDVTYQ